jgi:hypothetical protein
VGKRKHILAHKDEEFYYMDCDVLCFVHMAVGEVAGFELKLADVPAHNFVRCHLDDQTYFNWEMTVSLAPLFCHGWLRGGWCCRQECRTRFPSLAFGSETAC